MPGLSPISSPLLASRARFLEEHSLEEYSRAKRSVELAELSWDEYLEKHPKYAKLANQVTVLKSESYRKNQSNLLKAREQLERVRQTFSQAGISTSDDLNEVAIRFNEMKSKIAAARLLREIRSQSSPRSARALETSIRSHGDLNHTEREDLLKILNEQIESLLPQFRYKEVSGLSVVGRQNCYYAVLSARMEAGLETQCLENQRLPTELQVFREQKLTSLRPDTLDIPPLESLRQRSSKLQAELERDYAQYAVLCEALKSELQARFRETEESLKRKEQQEGIFSSIERDLRLVHLVSKSQEQRKFLFERLRSRREIRDAGLETELEIKIRQSEARLERLSMLRQKVFENFHPGMHQVLESVEEIERDLESVLLQIDRATGMDGELNHILRHEAMEIAQTEKIYLQFRLLCLELWNLGKPSERHHRIEQFISEIPFISGRFRVVKKLRALFRLKEARHLLRSMREVIEHLTGTLLDTHQEARINARFQESEIELEKLGYIHQELTGSQKRTPILKAYHRLKSQHEYLLAENQLLRKVVVLQSSMHELSMEAQERVMPWLAYRWSHVLRISKLLDMMGAQLLPPGVSGDLSIGAFEYHLTPFQRALIKSYVQEALQQFTTSSRQTEWLPSLILQELRAVQEQIGDGLASR